MGYLVGSVEDLMDLNGICWDIPLVVPIPMTTKNRWMTLSSVNEETHPGSHLGLTRFCLLHLQTSRVFLNIIESYM